MSLSRRQKLVVVLAGVTRAASGAMLGTALVVYVGREGSPAAVGLLAAAFFAGMMIFSPVWGALGDLTGRRKSLLVAVSVATTGVAAAFLLVTGSVPGLVGMRAVYGVFAVGFAPLMLSIVGALAGPERRGRSAAFFSSSVAGGTMGGQMLVGVLLGLLVPSELFLLIAALGLLATAVAAFVADPDARGSPATDLGQDGVVARVRGRLLPSPEERTTLRRTGLTTLYGALALRHAAVKGVGALVPIYLLTRVDVSEAVMGVLLTVNPAAQIVLLSLFGRLADVRARKTLIVFGLAVSGAHGVLMAAASVVGDPALGVGAVVAASLAVAAGFSAMDLGTIALVGDAVPPTREAAFIGLRSTAGGAGGVVGPLAVGTVATVTGFATAFALAGLLSAVAAVIVWRTLVEPDRLSPPTQELRTVEVATGMARPPGMLRGPEDD